MSAPQCRGCKAQIRWLKTPTGKPIPVDPERLQEWITDEPRPGARRITLVAPEGYLVSGYQASVITPGARQIEGYLTHFSTCPQAKSFRKGTQHG